MRGGVERLRLTIARRLAHTGYTMGSFCIGGGERSAKTVTAALRLVRLWRTRSGRRDVPLLGFSSVSGILESGTHSDGEVTSVGVAITPKTKPACVWGANSGGQGAHGTKGQQRGNCYE